MAKTRALVVYGCLVVISIGLMSLPKPNKIYVAEVYRAGLFSFSQWLFSRVSHYAHNQEKMHFLLRQNVEFALDNMERREAAWENVRLREALRFAEETSGNEIIPAEVVGRHPDLLDDTILINAGSDRAVRPDLPVITANGLVGHVIQVDKSSSIVQLLMRSKVSAIVQDSRAQGIVSWVDGERFRLRFVDTNRPVKRGDRVISSGLGGRYPKGIPIGLVTDVLQEKRDPVFQSIYLESLVDFGDLEEVFVLSKKSKY
jgi:rod shape-determining protein MreC